MTQRSSAIPLTAALAGLIIYASLYPFTGWRWPGGAPLWQLLQLPMPPWRDRFDMVANLVGYIPLGMLAVLAGVRSQGRPWRVWLLAMLLPAALSYGLEITQQFLPGRYPSLLDWLLNAAGAVMGASLGMLLQKTALIDHWQAARDRWFLRRSAGALALMLLWPMGLLFPLPMPLGMGVSWERMRGGLLELLADVSWARDWQALVSAVPVSGGRLPLMIEWLGMVLGLLGPCLLAFAVTRPGWRRGVLALAAALLACAATTLSAALNFGPTHATAWLTPMVLPAFAVGLGLAMLLVRLPQRLAAALGVVALSGLLLLVAQAPADPYFALSLQAWEQGRFIRFHGLAKWVGWLWPCAAIVWLMGRVASADRMAPLPHG